MLELLIYQFCACTCVIGNITFIAMIQQLIKVRCDDGDWICENLHRSYIHFSNFVDL